MRFDFNDDDVKDSGLKYPKLDLKKDEVARVCVITPYFDVTVRHWVNRVGYVHCHGVQEAKQFSDLVTLEQEGGNPESCIMCSMALRADTKDMVGLPLRHAATYVLRYHTDTRGNLLHGQLGYHLEVWMLANKKFSEVHKLQTEWKDKGGLQYHDLELTCIDSKYKNLDMSLKTEALWAKADKEEQKKIIAYVRDEVEKYPLMTCLGDNIPKDVLMRRFEIIRRKNYPDDEVDLAATVVGSEKLGEDIIPQTVPQEDPFKLTDSGGEIPSAVTPEEEKAAQKVEGSSTLDDLIP